MIKYKDITLEDKEVITSITMNSDRKNCDLSFSNLCSWRFMYGTQFAIVDGFLVIKFDLNQKPAYMLPVGEGDLKKILESLIEDAETEGQPFLMYGICNNTKEEIENLMPHRFEFSSNRDYADYVYLRTDLAELKGKKYQSKRNHVNKFYKTYSDYEYTPITSGRISECLRLEEEWCRANNCGQQNGLGNERKSLTYALNHFDELGLTGGILYVSGKIAAFTFGMPINQETFGIHVEKADTQIEGAYNIINQEFARHIPEQYIYLNREEDLGIEGLRKAKLSYQPAILLEKYIAKINK
ncbi:phosphatidylglycerol lysyltransferase domain-containing protein [uncultured Bacteroides sp.]|uniref:DUF2156 domain-containing protein n=1 Tax=uncultured Bacteroides sp. TaxID=162156 RepID=UPI002AAA766E|nr:phosphatidylglycerol lysyltransferase domain-containing protein [uncultured Bacteroides sp.]